jgi:heptosyltransferase-1
VTPRIHAVQRSRVLCAHALGYQVPQFLYFGLVAQGGAAGDGAPAHEEVVFAHGTSREDKCWPEGHWITLGQRLIASGHGVGLPHGTDAERARSERLAAALGPRARVWPALALGALADRLAGSAGVIGVDSGLSHVAVALDLPHVQIYNFDTAWRTGPAAANGRQHSVFARPTPTVDTVWHAWRTARTHA